MSQNDLFEREWRHRLELRDLVERYGSAADRRDKEGFADVFDHNGMFVTSKGMIFNGRAEIASLVDGLTARYRRTMHLIGRQDVQLGSGGARGSVTCLAHHLYRGTGGELRDSLMLIEYADTYVHDDDDDDDGGWRIARREVDLAWTLDRPVEITA